MLVVGSGGREHALAWKLGQSSLVKQVICAPGNGGIEKDARCIRVPTDDHAAVLELARSERIDCVVIGPEAPLAAGLADTLRANAVPVVGPSRAAAQLESSKVFAKEFMVRHGIPTAPFSVYDRSEDALARLGSAETRYPIVIKADGLAAGKGVVVARSAEEARKAIHQIMIERRFGSAGERIVMEDFLEGIEASYIVFTDGKRIIPAVASQDHKAVNDNDTGPNTGGMGAYSTDHILDSELLERILDQIVRPTIEGMDKEGMLFQGILYAGLMLKSGEPHVLEFNVRMGDPEGQVILTRLESDFAVLCECLCQGRLSGYEASWTGDAAVCVVLASGGYPGSYQTGRIISGLDMAEEDDSIVVFHSGTVLRGGNLVTNGGRVLGITAVRKDLASAVMAAYEAVNKIHFEGMHCRRDIGAKGLRRGGGRPDPG
jgi:phosphoribosylamine--glycine ligase